MKRLTKEEIQEYILPKNARTGVDAITEAMLSDIDLDSVPLLTRDGNVVIDSNGARYKFDSFTPVSGSYAFKPSFAGRQILIGKYPNGKLLFSNGRWFCE